MISVFVKHLLYALIHTPPSTSQQHRSGIGRTGRRRLRSLHLRLLLLSLRLLLLGRTLQRAHLARLHAGDLLLADMDATVRVAQAVVRHVALLRHLQLARLLARQLVQVVGGDLRAPNGEVHRRSDLGQLDARRLEAGFLQQDLVRPEQDLIVIGGREAEHVLDALQPNGVDGVTVECVDEQRLEAAQLLGLRPFRAVEDQTRLDARADLLVLELAERFVVLDAQLDHVEQFVLEDAAEDQVVGALLGRGAEQEKRAVVLLGEAARA